MAQILNAFLIPFYNQQVTYDFSRLITRRSQDRIQPTVPINQEIMAHRAIGNELNILLLSGSYVYFAVFCLQLVGDPDVLAEIRTDKGRGV